MPKLVKARRETKAERRGLCTAVREDGHECQAAVPSDAPMSLCVVHALLAAQWVAEARPDLTERALGALVLKPDPEPIPHEPTAVFRHGKISVVYYLSFGSLIKIGTSVNLPSRLDALPHDAVLAIEPGSYTRERTRHHQFQSSRHHHEWFRRTPELLAHIEAVRQRHGEPMATWERITTRRDEADAWIFRVLPIR